MTFNFRKKTVIDKVFTMNAKKNTLIVLAVFFL
jgi:hypothetical protein